MEDVAKTLSEETADKKEDVKISSDEAITKEKDDLLNRKPFVERVVSLIKANVEPPYSIGIYGDWGSGKTTIMRLIEEKIRKSRNYRVIWFDAWEYENETNLIYPLIRLIQKEIPTNKLKKVKEPVKRLGSVLLEGVMGFALKTLTVSAVSIKDLKEYEADYIKRHTEKFNDWIDEVGKVKKAFRELTEAACKPRKGEKKKKKECIMIFIDDLDRCLPENTIKILESIKNIFSKGNCVFILGVDKRTIAQIIKGRYSTLTEVGGKNYLDKIILYGFDVPECGVLDFDKYFSSLMYKKLKMEPNTAGIDLRFIREVCVSSRLHNLRKIKRSLIAFYLYCKIKQSSGFDSTLQNDIPATKISNQDVLMFCLFYEFWSDLFEKVLISNRLLAELTGLTAGRNFRDWAKIFSDEKTYPILKSFAIDHNLYQFLWHWKRPQDEKVVNALIRIRQLIGLKEK